jgi:hypothetical protein
MAFSSIVDDSRRMNAKMIAMGQSIDIQKMPRPKAGSQIAQKQMMFTPSGSDVEKMLYPKNFKPRAFEPEPQVMQATIQEPTKASVQEAAKTQEIVEQVMEEQKPVPQIIGDEEMEESTQIVMPNEEKSEVVAKPFPKNTWESCKHYKKQGNRAFCREYLGWCAENRCARPKI